MCYRTLAALRAAAEEARHSAYKGARAHWLADAWFGAGKCKVSAKSMSRVEYVWFDLWSVPQADPEQQKKAIKSIFSYVHDAAQFVVLAGAWEHEDGSTDTTMATSLGEGAKGEPVKAATSGAACV